MHERTRAAAILGAVAWVLAATGSAQTAELKPATWGAFESYVRVAEQRMENDLRTSQPFLLPDEWPQERREQAYEQLRRGEMVIERRSEGEPSHVPGGLVHDWTGVVFIPGATLEQTLTLIQDYDRHEQVYSPEVMRSRLVRRQGDDFQIFLRLKKHKVVTVVLDTEYEAHFARLDAHRAWSRSHSTRIAEVDNAGQANEHALPPGKDHGYLWALDTYWRFLEVEDGVFVQCEAISLTRDVPTGLGWLVGPFIQSIPRESLSFTLATTRKAVQTISATEAQRHRAIEIQKSPTAGAGAH